ncbi:MAG: hypothetical protein ACUVSY_13780 [Roseiflexus sp.]
MQGSIGTRLRDPVRMQPALRHIVFPVVMALMLGIFNPALCILHCTIAEAQAYRQTPSGALRFICHFYGASDTQSDTQTGMHNRQTIPPRAFYEGVILLITLIVTLLMISLLPLPACLPRYGNAPQPPIPPPKSLHHCPSCALLR